MLRDALYSLLHSRHANYGDEFWRSVSTHSVLKFEAYTTDGAPCHKPQEGSRINVGTLPPPPFSLAFMGTALFFYYYVVLTDDSALFYDLLLT